MAIVCDDLGMVFIMVPGTGCSVIGSTLRRDFGGRFLPELDIVKDGRVVHPMKHNSVSQIRRDGLLDPETLQRYLVVATVRSPLDSVTTYYQRAVGPWRKESLDFQERRIASERQKLTPSEYRARVRSVRARRRRGYIRHWALRAMGFKTWIVLSTIRGLVGHRAGSFQESYGTMLEGVDVVIRYEDLEAGLNEVLASLGVSRNVTLARRNVTPEKRPWREYYGPITFRLATWSHREELGRFGVHRRGGGATRLVWLNDQKRPDTIKGASAIPVDVPGGPSSRDGVV